LTRRSNEFRILNLTFDQKSTLVVADAILDEYAACVGSNSKLSAEDVTTVLGEGHRLQKPGAEVESSRAPFSKLRTTAEMSVLSRHPTLLVLRA